MHGKPRHALEVPMSCLCGESDKYFSISSSFS